MRPHTKGNIMNTIKRLTRKLVVVVVIATITVVIVTAAATTYVVDALFH